MNKIALSIVSAGFIIALSILFFGNTNINNTNSAVDQVAQNVEIKDGIQYVTINARGGYFPRVSTAKADLPTKLIVKTDGTYDCSSYLVINSLGYKNILPPDGDTVVDLGIQKTGKSISGTCGMGMYYFTLDFK